MPIAFIISGLLLIVTGIKGNPSQLWTLVQGDFTGKNNYVYWMLAVLVLGGIGYVPELKNFSRLFLVLVILVLLLHNRGFFANLKEFINSSQTSTATS
jgi:hypothetical protein